MRIYEVRVRYMTDEGVEDSTTVSVTSDSSDDAANQAIEATQEQFGTEVIEVEVLSEYNRCSNCDGVWEADELEPLTDVTGGEDLLPSVDPVGLCPDCGHSCYPEIDA